MNDETPLAQVFQINISNGGVPKLPIRSTEISYLGLKDDCHNDVEHHGGPDKAVSLYSLELSRALQGEGHPIFPGSTGENITLVGLDWSLVVAGLCLQLGDTVQVEISRYATPCQTIRESFTGHDFNRISWRTNLGWARAYARVLKPGEIRVGDWVRVFE